MSKKVHFNAAHRLFNPEWNDEKNFAVFGKCSYPNYHGHNYELIVTVTGEVDSDTGFVLNLHTLEKLVGAKVLERFDHRNLNLDIEEFKGLNPTAENIAIVIWNILREEIGKDLALNVKLFETEKNFVEYHG